MSRYFLGSWEASYAAPSVIGQAVFGKPVGCPHEKLPFPTVMSATQPTASAWKKLYTSADITGGHQRFSQKIRQTAA
jgi:hypothetical protein